MLSLGDVLTSDALPEVSFNLDLGRRLEYIDFNYDDYIDHLQKAGLGDEEVAATKIEFKNSREPEYVAVLPQGSFDTYEKKIIVKVLRFASESRVNDRLRHETSHWVDDCKGQRSTAATVIGNLAILSGITSTWGSLPLLIAEGFTNSETIDSIGSNMRTAGLGLLLFGAFFRHFIDPNEKRAYREQRKETVPFVTLRNASKK